MSKRGEVRKILRNEITWLLTFIGVIVVATLAYSELHNEVITIKENHLPHLEEKIDANRERVEEVCDKMEENSDKIHTQNLKLERIIIILEQNEKSTR